MSKENITRSELMKILKVMATQQRQSNSLFATFLPNPSDLLKKIGKGIDSFTALEDDAHIWSCMQSRKSGSLSLLWDIDRGKESNEQNKFVNDIFKNLKIRRIIEEMLEGAAYGYKVLEVVWLKKGDWIIPIDVIGKPQEWFSFDSQNRLRFNAIGKTEGEIVPNKKFLLLQYNSTYTNPYGSGYLSKCWWAWTFKKGGMKFWVKFTEKYGMPWAWAKMPRGINDSEKEDMLIMLDELKQDGVAVLPDDSDVGTLDATKSSSADLYEKLVHFCNAEISKAILSQTLTTEQGDTGAYAMSQTHLQVRQDVIDTDCSNVEQAMNTLIRWIVDLNWDNIIDYPTFSLYPKTTLDKTLAERDSLLFGTGYIKPTQQYIDRAYGFDTGDVVVLDKKDGDTSGALAEDTIVPFAEQDSPNNTVTLTDEVIGDFKVFSDDMLKRVAELINSAATYEELEREIINIYPELDDNGIIDVLTKATTIARAGGHLVPENQ